MGDIGAHTAKDISPIIDVEPRDPQTSVEPTKSLLKEWYVARHGWERKSNELEIMVKDKAMTERDELSSPNDQQATES